MALEHSGGGSIIAVDHKTGDRYDTYIGTPGFDTSVRYCSVGVSDCANMLFREFVMPLPFAKITAALRCERGPALDDSLKFSL